MWLFALICTIAVVIKSGFGIAPLNEGEFQNFPLPPNYWSALTYGPRLTVYLTGRNDEIAFSVVGIILTLIAIATIVLLAVRRFQDQNDRIFVAIVLISPIGMVLLNRIGQADVFVILGAAVIAISSPRIHWFILGTVIMLLGNPEQTVVSFLGLVILSLISSFKTWRRRAITGLLVSVTVFILLSILARSVGAKNRLEYLPELLSASFYAFAANLPLSLYAAFGATWLIIFWVIAHLRKWDRLWFLVSLVALPLLVIMLTVDQTRVFVGVTTLSVLVTLTNYLPMFKDWLNTLGIQPVLAVVLLALLFLPIIDIWGSSGHARTPYLWIFTSVVPEIKGFLIG